MRYLVEECSILARVRLSSSKWPGILRSASALRMPHPALLAIRAAELFDWLRALPRDHQLSKLADLYTYTTLISQVGIRSRGCHGAGGAAGGVTKQACSSYACVLQGAFTAQAIHGDQLTLGCHATLCCLQCGSHQQLRRALELVGEMRRCARRQHEQQLDSCQPVWS